MDVNWSGNGNGDQVLVVARSGSAVNADPANGTSYTANAAFGSGTEIGTGNYVVYKGSGSTVNVTSLMAGTTYHYAVYAFNSSDNCYNTANKLIGNATTTTPPPVITHTGTSPAASNINQGSTNNVLYSIKVDVATTATTLNNLVATTGGDWANGDVDNFKLWFSTDATFGSDTEIKSVTNPSPGDITFSSLTQAFPIGTRYLFVTCDIAAAGTINKTVSAFVDTDGDMTYNNSPTFSGSTFAAGNLKTIIGVTELQMQYPVNTDVSCGFTVPFGNIVVNQNSSLTFRIKNIGTGDLNLTTLPLTIGGTNANQFSITTQPTSPISPNDFRDVVVQFTPTSTGSKTANISIANSDSDENPCVVNLSGSGVLANDNCSGAISLSVSSNESCTGSVNGTSTGGTQSLSPLLCNTLTGNSDDDVWYSFVATATSHIITVDGASNMDAVIDLRSGACDGTNLDCADQTGTDGIEVLTETGLNIGDTYFIRVYDFATGGGDFTICVTTPEPPKHFRTVASGNFSSASIWETSPDGNDPWTAATYAPRTTDLSVTMRAPNDVTVSAPTSIDQTTIEAGSKLEVISTTLTIANGTGTDLTVNGVFRNTLGTITTSGTIDVTNGGKYQHNYTSGAGVIPTATWSSGSTCEILAMTISSTISSLGQNFWHLIWNTSALSSNMNLNSSIKTVKGDFTVASTGSGSIRLAGSVPNDVTIEGNLILENGTKMSGGSGTQSFNMNIFGGLTINGNGILNLMDGGSSNGVINLKGNLSASSSSTITEGTSGTGCFIKFNGTSQQTATFGSLPEKVNFEVNGSPGVSLASNMTLLSNADLKLTSGYLILNNFNLDMSSSNTTITGGSNSSYILTNGTGTLKRTVAASSINFPIGNATYNPLVLSNTGTSDIYSARVSNAVLAQGDSGTEYTEKTVDRTWFIDEAVVGGSNVSATFQWNAGDELTNFTRTLCYTGHFKSGAWDVGAEGAASGSGPFTRQRTGITSFSPFAVASGGALPVVLSKFTATKRKNSVDLQWQTLSETNCDYFGIERSNNGNDYNELSQIRGAGTTISTNDYQYTDHAPAQGDNYYRLRQVDFDGSFSYSPIRVISMNNGKDINVIPTVAYADIRLDLSESLEADAQIDIIEVSTGRIVQTINLSAETSSQTMSVADFAAGMYFVKMINGSEVITKRFVVIK